MAELARVSMTICDRDGRLLTRPSCLEPVCRLLGAAEPGRAACAADIESAAAAKECCGERTCHAGLAQFRVPIELDGAPLGCIVVGHRPTGPAAAEKLGDTAPRYGLEAADLARAAEATPPWTESQRRATLHCASALARAIAQLCRQEQFIRHRVEELTAMYDLAGLLSGTSDLQAVLDATTRRVTEVMGVKACLIRLLDEDTGELVMKAGHNLSPEYINKGPVVLGRNPIDDAAFAGETVHIVDAATDSRLLYPEEAVREGIVSGLCTAMMHRGQTVGVIRVYTGEPHRFSALEISLLKAVASTAAAAIANARLYAQRQEALRYRQHLQYAGEIQRRMIPGQPPPHRYLDFAGVYAPRLEVGGDFYDFIDLPWGNVGVCIADVVGKGIPAALMMASVRAALRGHAHTILEINEILARVNRHLCRDTLTREFATLFYGVFSPDGGQLVYCNAGHSPPLLLRGDEFTRLETGGMLIGVSSKAVYERASLALHPGDLLVFYTDGVTEALNFQGEAFGQQRLEASIRHYRREETGTIAQQLLWDVRRFTGLAAQTDDITVVVARVRQPA